MRRRSALGLLALLLVLVLAGFAGALALQRSVMYPRPPAPARAPALPPGATAAHVGPGEQVEAWLLPPTRAVGPHPVLVYTHGNGELIDYWLDGFEPARSAGIGVLLVEYPGYGRSGGAPSLQSIRQTILAAYDWLAVQPGVDRERIVAWGRSLGGGAACELARERHLAALVLESTFTSVPALARRLGVPGALVRDRFDNLAALSGLQLPVLVMHGERDDLIPFAHGEALAQATGAPLLRLPCGHNDCARPWRELLRFFAQHGITPVPATTAPTAGATATRPGGST